MKSGEDFRRAMGQADDGFVNVINQVLSDLRVMRTTHRPRRRRIPPLTGRHESAAVVKREA